MEANIGVPVEMVLIMVLALVLDMEGDILTIAHLDLPPIMAVLIGDLDFGQDWRQAGR